MPAKGYKKEDKLVSKTWRVREDQVTSLAKLSEDVKQSESEIVRDALDVTIEKNKKKK